MQELINQLVQKAGISADQANKAVLTMKDYIKEKFPMVAGAVDNLFSGEAAPAAEKKTEEGMLDKISDIIPGAAGEKVEQFAKNAADKAGDAIDGIKDKLGSIFDSKKS